MLNNNKNPIYTKKVFFIFFDCLIIQNELTKNFFSRYFKGMIIVQDYYAKFTGKISSQCI